MNKIQKTDHFYLIDGSGYIFRAYYALPPLTRKSDGLPTGAVSGFCSMLFKLIIATSTIYILGLIWLGTLIGWDKPIFALGAKPFLLAEIFKIMLLALLTKQIIKIKKSI